MSRGCKTGFKKVDEDFWRSYDPSRKEEVPFSNEFELFVTLTIYSKIPR